MAVMLTARPEPEQGPDAEQEQPATDPAAPPPARGPRRSFWSRFRGIVLLTVLTLVLVGAAVGAWYALPLKTVQISGNQHLSAKQVKTLSGLSRKTPMGWLYYGAWRAGGLIQEPWIASARITRVFPDRVNVAITERIPVAQVITPDGKTSVVAGDGTVLPGAAPTGPIISGWGPDRTGEALYAAKAFSRYNVESVKYTPTGITLQTGQGSIWSGSLALLLKYGQASETQAQSGRINIYPWGVSVQR